MPALGHLLWVSELPGPSPSLAESSDHPHFIQKPGLPVASSGTKGFSAQASLLRITLPAGTRALRVD